MPLVIIPLIKLVPEQLDAGVLANKPWCENEPASSGRQLLVQRSDISVVKNANRGLYYFRLK